MAKYQKIDYLVEPRPVGTWHGDKHPRPSASRAEDIGNI
jgi:hypothetical protein